MQTPKNRPEPELMPVWFQLRPRFYRRLKAIADECGAEMSEILTAGIELYLKRHRDKEAQEPTKKGQAPANTPAALSSYRWSKVSPEERSRLASEMSKKRWSKRVDLSTGSD